MLQSEPQSSEHWLHALQHVHQANTSAYFCAAKGVRKALVWLRTSAKLESRSRFSRPCMRMRDTDFCGRTHPMRHPLSVFACQRRLKSHRYRTDLSLTAVYAIDFWPRCGGQILMHSALEPSAARGSKSTSLADLALHGGRPGGATCIRKSRKAIHKVQAKQGLRLPSLRAVSTLCDIPVSCCATHSMPSKA